MKEIREIIQAYERAEAVGLQAALVTVVHLDGSSYRRPGARMLVTDDGLMTGAISGGCLEGDALRKALLVMGQGENKLLTYDTSDEDDATIGVQLGCAGIIQVLFEPIHKDRPDNPIQLLRSAAASRGRAAVVTMFSLENRQGPQAGTCLVRLPDGSMQGGVPIASLQKVLADDIAASLHEGHSLFRHYRSESGGMNAFVECLQPPVSLVIVGAGNDAIPLMELASDIGWDVRVVDGRPTYAKSERFTSACQVLVSKPEKVLEQVPVDDRTAFVLMTHNYNYDLAMLRALLPLDVTYIGVLGPRKKLERMLEELRDGGMEITRQQLDKVYGPTGLEIGAETAGEIALSILAEIQAVLHGKSGGSLRDKPDVIHDRSLTTMVSKNIADA